MPKDKSKANKLVIFDIDGTLLVSFGAGRRAFDRAFYSLHGVTSAWGETKAHGRTDPDLIDEISNRTLKRSLDTQEYIKLKNLYIDLFKEEVAKPDVIELMTNSKQLVESLHKNKDNLLGIETGNFKETAHLKLQHGNLLTYFSFGGFACDSSNREIIIQESIKRGRAISHNIIKEIIVIGDSINDIKSAKRNKAIAIGVATGSSSINDLKNAGADLAYESFNDFNKIAEDINAM